ncbi:hypothetical protein LZ31DRAFT_555403 [Colletotrichum somersetense]|nr:hypothetical protein LZ31DRAFT_555403 [Colletotrichum somersetense]
MTFLLIDFGIVIFPCLSFLQTVGQTVRHPHAHTHRESRLSWPSSYCLLVAQRRPPPPLSMHRRSASQRRTLLSLEGYVLHTHSPRYEYDPAAADLSIFFGPSEKRSAASSLVAGESAMPSSTVQSNE